MQRPEILEIRVERIIDEEPPMTGKYSSEPGDGAIDLHERGIHSNSLYQYWIPEEPEYADEGLAERKDWERGLFQMVGIVAVVTAGSTWKRRRFTSEFRSNGVWGIRSDDASGLKECAECELDDIRRVLASVFGIDWNESMASDAICNPVEVYH